MLFVYCLLRSMRASRYSRWFCDESHILSSCLCQSCAVDSTLTVLLLLFRVDVDLGVCSPTSSTEVLRTSRTVQALW